MSCQEAPEPVREEADRPVHLVIRPQEKNLGEFSVRRALPAFEQQLHGIQSWMALPDGKEGSALRRPS